jgi:hypothetical protein
LNDLRKLSEQELFTKTIQGLAKIEDSSKRNRLAAQLLGDEFKKIDVRTVAAAMGTGGGASAGAIQAAADAQRNLSKQLNNLSNALINVFRPLNELIAKINISVAVFEALIKTILVLGTALLAMSLYGRIVAGLSAAFAQLGAAVETVQAFFFTLSARLSSGGRIATFFSDKLAAIGVALTNLITKLPGVSTAVAYMGTLLQPLVGLFTALGAATYAWWESLKKIFGFKKDDLPNIPGRDAGNVIADALKRKKEEKEVVDATRKSADEYLRNVIRQTKEMVEQAKLRTQMLGMTQREGEEAQLLLEQRQRMRAAIEDIQQKMKEPGISRDAIAALQYQLDQYKKIQGAADATALAELRRQHAIQRTMEQKAAELKMSEDIARLIDADIQRYQTLGDILRGLEEQRKDLRFENLSVAGLSDTDKEFARIRRRNQQELLATQRQFAESFGEGDQTPERMKELQDGLDKIARAYRLILTEQESSILIAQQWSVGWSEAFQNYYDNATNAANRARETFSSVTRAMESAIDRFVETGKFSFKDFTRSVLADLLKIELKAAAMNFLGSMKGGFLGSLFSSFAGFFAQGGYIPPGKSGIVGEAGPELVTGPANVTPMGQLNGGTTINNYYNISAIDSRSVAQFFAENRRTMLGATEQARKELPIRQRF